MERRKCWLSPMRPVTPFMMIPTEWIVGSLMECGVITLSVFRCTEGGLRRGVRGHRRRPWGACHRAPGASGRRRRRGPRDEADAPEYRRGFVTYAKHGAEQSPPLRPATTHPLPPH